MGYGLSITRRKGQAIVIGDDIEVAVVRDNEFGPGIVLSVIAPAGVSVDREEVWRDKRNAKARQAAERGRKLDTRTPRERVA